MDGLRVANNLSLPSEFILTPFEKCSLKKLVLTFLLFILFLLSLSGSHFQVWIFLR